MIRAKSGSQAGLRRVRGRLVIQVAAIPIPSLRWVGVLRWRAGVESPRQEKTIDQLRAASSPQSQLKRKTRLP